MALSVTCSGCGSAVPVGDRFCGSCGNPITGSAVISGEGAAAFDPWVELLQKLRQATIGEYEIKGELGRGGMAAVFLAHDLHLNRKVAVKVMLPGLLYSERMWERFLQEARTAAKLDHPNIIYIHSVKEKDRFLYFVMKYVDGRPMDDLLSRPGMPMPVNVAQTILVEVARGLDYAHREGIVHRDIKPANIMIDNKGAAIVMDFGIARVEDSAHFTQTGATIGTPAYMSPEQCHGQDVTAASDQYSLGVVAYELFSGSAPFTGSPIELQLAHIQDVPTPLGELRRDLPAELASAVMRMLEKDPAKRFGSLAQLVQKFSVGLDQHDQSPRDALVEMVKSGPVRRQSYPPTPISPPPGSLAASNAAAKLVGNATRGGALKAQPPKAVTPAAQAPSAKAPASKTPSYSILVDAGADDAVRSAETAAVPAMGAVDAQSRPTAAIESGPHGAITMGLPARDGHSGITAESPARSNKMLLYAGAAVVVLGSAIGLFVAKSGGSTTSGTSGDSAAIIIPPPSAAVTVEAALGDSVVVGHGADATTPTRGRAPKTVAADAIALFNISLSRPGVRVGDTVRVRLDALDDTGERVTSPQIVWATSNPRVAKFAGPGMLVGVSQGRATITVSAASTTGTLPVTIAARGAARGAAAPTKRKQP